MKIQLENTEETLDLGITGSGEFFIEFFEQKLAIRVEPSKIVPNKWHKIVITKQHHKLTLKVDAHQETLHLDSGWPKLSFSNEPLLFTGTYVIYFSLSSLTLISGSVCMGSVGSWAGPAELGWPGWQRPPQYFVVKV